jgi:hypothetical protein
MPEYASRILHKAKPLIDPVLALVLGLRFLLYPETIRRIVLLGSAWRWRGGGMFSLKFRRSGAEVVEAVVSSFVRRSARSSRVMSTVPSILVVVMVEVLGSLVVGAVDAMTLLVIKIQGEKTPLYAILGTRERRYGMFTIRVWTIGFWML